MNSDPFFNLNYCMYDNERHNKGMKTWNTLEHCQIPSVLMILHLTSQIPRETRSSPPHLFKLLCC